MTAKILALVAALSSTAFMVSTYPARAKSADEPGEWKAPPSAAEKKNPVASSAQALAAGRAIYNHACVSCHGDKGKGDGKDAHDLEPSPADLSMPDVTGQTDGALFWKITNGRKPMPTFRKDLSDEARWQVIIYVRTLAQPGGK